ncbi:hypothetical protein Slala04_77700 [Streptomyces lavendulae subsp. lavendulae]|nr:hypothetical protein Slala04_77700 [Streptomyces lavendulae subsp. lavendulae]
MRPPPEENAKNPTAATCEPWPPNGRNRPTPTARRPRRAKDHQWIPAPAASAAASAAPAATASPYCTQSRTDR